MDTLTVALEIVITGLVLLTPGEPGGGGPLHLLMPQATNMPSHVTWIAFEGEQTPHCAYYGSGICVVDMDGWSMEVAADQEEENPTSIHIPENILNVTQVSGGRRTPRAHLQHGARRRVRSRITLHGSGTITTCNLGKWRYKPVIGNENSHELANVATWRNPTFTQNRLVLLRTRLDAESGDRPEVLEILRSTSGDIELQVMHAPIAEALRYLVMIEAVRTPTPAPPAPPKEPPVDSEATHFHAYYELLQPRKGDRPLPKYVGLATQNQCPALKNIRLRTTAGEFSCMVASAFPQ